jgi:hypothetical protein
VVRPSFQELASLCVAAAMGVILFGVQLYAKNSGPREAFPPVPKNALAHLKKLEQGVVDTASASCPGEELQRSILADALAGFIFHSARKSPGFKRSRIVVDLVYIDNEEEEKNYDLHGNENTRTTHSYIPIFMASIPTSRLRMINPRFGGDWSDNLGACSLVCPGISEDRFQTLVKVFVANAGSFKINQDYISLSLPKATPLGASSSN